jgi:hypothetical protein
LKKLELPRGWWTAPRLIQEEEPDDAPQPGANTGTIAEFQGFEQLRGLVTHSTAILKKGLHDMEVADPIKTLPSNVRDILVYGAHDGLWSWVNDILDCERSHFTDLRKIELRCEEPVHTELKLSTMEELRSEQGRMYEKIRKSEVTVCGDL